MRPGGTSRANGWMGEVMSALAVVSRSADHVGDDLDLVAGVRAGDDRAFEALFLRYQPRITAYVRGMLHDHGRAEDITQEVFMSALRRMRETDSEIAFKPWIYEIAKNACIDAWRRSRNTNEVSFDAHDALGADDHGRLAEPGVTPDSAVDAKVAFDNLCGAFGGLSQTHHEILVMREFEGLSYREIGERLGMSRPGVESTLFRARRRLGEEYEELVSGDRCRRVQRIVDTPGGRAVGLRDQRRMARHISHCQPCRRYARLAGVDLDPPARPATAAAARIAALVPLPLFLRRRWGGEEAGQLLAQSHSGPLAQWSATIAGALDPATVSGWSKVLATAATVAVAGVGAGAAIRERGAIESLLGRTPATAGHATAHGSGGAAQRPRAVLRPTAPFAAAQAPAAPTSHAPTNGGGGGPAPRETSPSGGDGPAADVGTPQTATKLEQAGHELAATAPVAPAGRLATATAGEAAARQHELTLARMLDRLGAGAVTTAAPTADPRPAPSVGAVGRTGDLVAGALDAPAPAASSTTEARRAAPPELLATVSTTVADTLDATTAGRTAP